MACLHTINATVKTGHAEPCHPFPEWFSVTVFHQMHDPRLLALVQSWQGKTEIGENAVIRDTKIIVAQIRQRR